MSKRFAIIAALLSGALMQWGCDWLGGNARIWLGILNEELFG
jgi:hypothetical protein